jgi:hypothetical protein
VTRIFALFFSLFAISSFANDLLLTSTAQYAGEVYQNTHIKSQIELANAFDQPVQILKITPRRDADKVIEQPLVVPPRSTIFVPVDVFTAMDAGDRTHSFLVESSSGKNLYAHVKVFGVSVLDEPLPTIDLGIVESGAPANVKSLTLTSREISEFRISRITEIPDFIDVKIGADGRTLEAKAKDGATWGRHFGILKIAFDSPLQNSAWVQVNAEVRGEVIASRNPIDWGITKKNEIASDLTELTSKNGKAFKVGQIRVEGLMATAHVDQCPLPKAGCYRLMIRLNEDQATGRVNGRVWVDIPEFKQSLPIDIGGVLLDKTDRIISIDEQAKAVESDAAKQTSALSSSKVDLKKAIASVSQTKKSKINQVAAEGNGPLLKWQVSNEQAIHGYLVYRSDNENGGFIRINKETVLVTSDLSPGIVSGYQWRDTTAEAGKAYWYYIGIIYNDGHKQQLTGPQKVTAK